MFYLETSKLGEKLQLDGDSDNFNLQSNCASMMTVYVSTNLSQLKNILLFEKIMDVDTNRSYTLHL